MASARAHHLHARRHLTTVVATLLILLVACSTPATGPTPERPALSTIPADIPSYQRECLEQKLSLVALQAIERGERLPNTEEAAAIRDCLTLPDPARVASEGTLAPLEPPATPLGQVSEPLIPFDLAGDQRECIERAIGVQAREEIQRGRRLPTAQEEAVIRRCIPSLAITDARVTVRAVQSSYEAAGARPIGWFRSGQAADLMLSGYGFGMTGGPTLFNHPGNIASDGQRLLLADTRNNRVLIWNHLPQGNVAPDLVLGQPDFLSGSPGTGPDQLNWPVGVASDGQRVVVADSLNNRLLIWNHFPTENGQPADLILDGQTERKGKVRQPYGLWTNGQLLIVANRGMGQVLIWRQFPSVANQPADVVLDLRDAFGGPRSVASDGRRLIVADYDPFNHGKSGTFFWREMPTQDNQRYDFFMPTATGECAQCGEMLRAGFTADGKLVALGDHQLYLWHAFPADEHDTPDLVVGGGGDKGYEFNAGDTSGLAVVGDRLYISLMNGNLIVGYHSLPTRSTQAPDLAIGANSIYSDTLAEQFIIGNPNPASDGHSLFVASDFDQHLYVWKQIPAASGAHPDWVYSLPQAPWDIALAGQTLALAGQQSVVIWTKLPVAGNLPERVFVGRLGNVTFQELRGVALDERYFYLADYGANRIYVWKGIPQAEDAPTYVLEVTRPRRLSSDGHYLVVQTSDFSPRTTDEIYVWPVAELGHQAQPVTFLGGSHSRTNQAQKALVAQGAFFVADTGNNRVLIWRQVEDALAGHDPDQVLGAQDLEPLPGLPGQDRLYMPATLAFDGSYLWVGEFKFSQRLLRFSVQP